MLAACTVAPLSNDATISSFKRMETPENIVTANANIRSPAQPDDMSMPAKRGINGNRNDSIVTFTGTKGNSVTEEGAFYDINFQMIFNPESPENIEESHIALSVPIATMKTGNQLLTTHLLSKDFFDVQVFPQATFLSTKIKSLGGTKYEIAGNLTMHGVSKSLTLTAHISDTGLTMNHTLHRNDFNIGAPGGIDNEVQLNATIPFLP